MAQNAAGVLQESAAKEAIELRHDKEKDPRQSSAQSRNRTVMRSYVMTGRKFTTKDGTGCY
jgi:hypothetical protein